MVATQRGRSIQSFCAIELTVELGSVAHCSFEPIIQRSVGAFPKGAFKAALATQPCEITGTRSGLVTR